MDGLWVSYSKLKGTKKSMKMKKILLSLLLVFGSLNMFAQYNSWVKKTSPITGESWVQKSLVNEMGEETNLIFKVWITEPSYSPRYGKYRWSVIKNGQNVSVNASVGIKKGEEWVAWHSIKEGTTGLWMDDDKLDAFTNSSLLRIAYYQGEVLYSFYYLDLKGSSIALKSL